MYSNRKFGTAGAGSRRVISPLSMNHYHYYGRRDLDFGGGNNSSYSSTLSVLLVFGFLFFTAQFIIVSRINPDALVNPKHHKSKYTAVNNLETGGRDFLLAQQKKEYEKRLNDLKRHLDDVEEIVDVEKVQIDSASEILPHKPANQELDADGTIGNVKVPENEENAKQTEPLELASPNQHSKEDIAPETELSENQEPVDGPESKEGSSDPKNINGEDGMAVESANTGEEIAEKVVETPNTQDPGKAELNDAEDGLEDDEPKEIVEESANNGGSIDAANDDKPENEAILEETKNTVDSSIAENSEKQNFDVHGNVIKHDSAEI